MLSYWFSCNQKLTHAFTSRDLILLRPLAPKQHPTASWDSLKPWGRRVFCQICLHRGFVWLEHHRSISRWTRYHPQKDEPHHLKIYLERYLRFDGFSHRFLLLFVRFWKPTWRHVVHSFARNGGGLWRAPLFFDLLAVLAPLGAI